MDQICYRCGKPLGAHNLAWDYPIPDPVTDREDAIVVRTEQVITAQGLGSYVRVILPIPVDTGHEVTLGVWMAITDGALWDRILGAGRAGGDAWAGLEFTGRLAVAVRPWPEVFGNRATARVPGVDTVPRVVASVDEPLTRVLAGDWPEQWVVEARGHHVPGRLPG